MVDFSMEGIFSMLKNKRLILKSKFNKKVICCGMTIDTIRMKRIVWCYGLI
jgi:hypothetical protein